jgi:RecJ-like exonuclease
VELIEDALGGFNVADCNEKCAQNCEAKAEIKNTTDHTTNMNNVSTKNNYKKYAFDVVDLSVFSNASNQQNDVFQDDSGNSTLDDSNHKRIVRVSLQKSVRKSQGVCFRGGNNDSFAIYDLQKLVKTTEKYQNDINIRFKTSSTAGLLFLINQKFPNEFDTFMLLSIEKG